MAGLKTFAVKLRFEQPGKTPEEHSFRAVNAISNLSAIEKSFQKVRAKQGTQGHCSYGSEKTVIEVKLLGEPC